MSIKKEYTNGEINIVWQPRLCIHAAKCVEALPNVYQPNEKPWITPENATTEELIAQIKTCPSGALSYYKVGEQPDEDSAVSSSVRVEVLPNGPLMLEGDLDVKSSDGNVESRSKKTFFCRCGASANKPYCDGKHTKIGFEG